jgi:hypothetical protein
MISNEGKNLRRVARLWNLFTKRAILTTAGQLAWMILYLESLFFVVFGPG